MKRGIRALLCILVLIITISGETYKYMKERNTKDEKEAIVNVDDSEDTLLEDIVSTFGDKTPTKWSEHMDGVLSKVETNEKIIFLTFDACGGPEGSGYDKELIDFLIGEDIQATLFINSRWIDSNTDLFMELADNKLFEIENHGYEHRPLSVNGKEVYGIEGTKSVEEVYNEIQNNNLKIKKLTGRMPKFFRSGTAYYDDIAVDIAATLGQMIGGFTFTGDAGATFTKEQIILQSELTEPGAIILYHMNQPNSETYEGLKEVIPRLKKEGYKFKKLEDYIKD